MIRWWPVQEVPHPVTLVHPQLDKGLGMNVWMDELSRNCFFFCRLEIHDLKMCWLKNLFLEQGWFSCIFFCSFTVWEWDWYQSSKRILCKTALKKKQVYQHDNLSLYNILIDTLLTEAWVLSFLYPFCSSNLYIYILYSLEITLAMGSRSPPIELFPLSSSSSYICWPDRPHSITRSDTLHSLTFTWKWCFNMLCSEAISVNTNFLSLWVQSVLSTKGIDQYI